MSSNIQRLAQAWLDMRPHKAGETVQFGWFIFRIVSEGSPPLLETLDFKAIASFTTDFTKVEQIHVAQQKMLEANGVEGEDCTLRHSALVSRSYAPGLKDAFLKRDDPLKGNASGWYVGVENETLDIDNNLDSFVLKSLYELSIKDERMYPYWLLPVGTTVFLESGRVARST